MRLRFLENLLRPRSSTAELKVLLVLMHRFIVNNERQIMTIVSDLTDAAAKIAADVDTVKIANAAALAAKDAQITDLTAQLAAFQADSTAITAATQVLSDADTKLVAP